MLIRTTAALVAALTVSAIIPAGAAYAAPQGVHVVGTAGNHRLVVNGRTWSVKGVTWGFPQKDAAKYLPDVSRLGANTLRTWGVDSGTPTLLRAAAQRRMKVVVGQWLPHGADWVGDTAMKQRVRTQVLQRVADLKGEPGLLAWGLGNEVMIEQTAKGGATSEEQRMAYARFVDSLAQAVHAADPDHPVMSVEAIPRDWRALAQYAPNLDIIGTNAYASIGIVDKVFREAAIPQPYLVTETGPRGSWEEAADPLGGPADAGDAVRSAAVTKAIATSTANPGRSLGVTVFHYGDDSDTSGIRFGLRLQGMRRAAWYAVQKAYQGVSRQGAPLITAATVTTPAVVVGRPVRIAVAATDPDGDRVRWAALRTLQPWGSGKKLEPTAATLVAPGVLEVTAPASAGVHRIVLMALDGRGNVGTQTVTVQVQPVR